MGRRKAGRGAKKKAKDVDSLVPEIFKDMLREDRRREKERGSKRTVESPESSGMLGGSRHMTKRRKETRAEGSKDGSILASSKVVHDKMNSKQSVMGKEIITNGDLNICSELGTEKDIEDDSPSEKVTLESEDDSSDEGSDIDWEDVELGSKPLDTENILKETNKQMPSDTLELVLNDPKSKRAETGWRRKITAMDRRIRLETHKLHLICLLQHVSLRNLWCNDLDVHKNLRELISLESYDKLHHNPTDQQFRRSVLFNDGLQETVDAFRKLFSVTQRGLIFPRWQELHHLDNWKMPAHSEDHIKKDDFVAASFSLEGSRDLGAQLFCALLRSAGVNSRLVCSLQVLPFSFKSKNTSKNMKLPAIIQPSSSDENDPPPATLRNLKRNVKANQVLPESAYPVYWVEAWSIPLQKWIAVDPLVTGTVGKPSKMEPPRSDPLNTLVYVVAFESPTHCVDVTRRYARSYLGSTRRLRLQSTKGGSKWFQNLIDHFHRGFQIDRDQLEEAEFAQRELAEPIPNNVQDLKDHPLFALKRHLRRNEVIHPERKVGTITIGAGPKKKTEPIFRRADVKIVKTSGQWYRVGRTVLPEQEQHPLKLTIARIRAGKNTIRNLDPEDEGADEEHNLLMYSVNQTTLYTPPPVVEGLVPKNRFGNLDIFVPTMVPAGGNYIPHHLAAASARLIGIDYVDVVTGFDFGGRSATAKLKGVVIATQYSEAVIAVCNALVWQKEREEIAERNDISFSLWRRFLMRLRIRHRLGIEILSEVSGHRRKSLQKETKLDHSTENISNINTELIKDERLPKMGESGGFIPDHNETIDPFPVEGGGFLPEKRDCQPEDDFTNRSGFLPEKSANKDRMRISVLDHGGGFMSENNFGSLVEKFEDNLSDHK